jgi:uncharacterized membrane protein YebE (DUF533 family)
MSAQSMLEQLLKSGLSMLDGKAGRTPSQAPEGAGASDPGWGRFGAGAATGGLLGLLLGSQGGRRLGGKALKYGSVAALGVMAYRAYGNWQAQQQVAQLRPGAELAPSQPPASTTPAPRTVNLLPAPEVEQHSRAMLKAMIAAAKADGHLDQRERGLVEAELQQLAPDPVMRGWFEEELRRPLDPAEVAQAATTPELAAEMYLASLLVTDDTGFMERAYLDELARQLRLADGLKLELERQSRAA